jgi:hypothetical protein
MTSQKPGVSTAKDCPKPLRINVYISQGNIFFQGRFVVKINATKAKLSTY